jgi:Protein of unknown function (DUF3455)
MKCSPRLALAGLAVAVTAALAPAAAQAHYPPPIPSDVRVDAGNKLFEVGHAIGVQIYACNGSAWTFVAPRADLYNDRGKRIITHFAGPTWQANDGSQVVGRVAGTATVDPTAIPWLKLAKASTTVGPFGGDKLVKTTFIQRINTRGGLAPAASTCTAAATGRQVEIPYTADYTFWKAKGGGI